MCSCSRLAQIGKHVLLGEVPTRRRSEGGVHIPNASLSIIDDKTQLITLLHDVAEIEHTAMCQYLTAALTVKRAGEEGMTPALAERARRFQAGVYKVARQEMEHLALINNLLVAIGAAPFLWRPQFPVRYHYFPLNLAFSLRRLDSSALARFICFERPDRWELGSCGFDPSSLCDEQNLEVDLAADHPGMAHTFATVGDILLAVRDAVNNVHHRAGLDNLFTGSPQKEPVKNFIL